MGLLEELRKSTLVITSRPVINNYYYITIDNRAIKVTEPEFLKQLKKDNIQTIEGKKWYTL